MNELPCVASSNALFQCSRLISGFHSGAEGPRLGCWGRWRVAEREKAVHAKKRQATAEGGGAPAAEAAPESGEPNAILFVQKLPEATTAPMLTKLFAQFPGFKEVRARVCDLTSLPALSQPGQKRLWLCWCLTLWACLLLAGTHGGGQAGHRVCGV